MIKDGTRNLRLTQNPPTAQDSGAGCGLHHEHLSQENSASEGSHLINRDQTARLERLAAAARLVNQIPPPGHHLLALLARWAKIVRIPFQPRTNRGPRLVEQREVHNA